MQQISMNGVKLYNPIESKMPNIIDSFVAVYGEKYRIQITQKLNNAIYFNYGGGGEAQFLEQKMKELSERRTNIVNLFYDKYGFDINEAVHFDVNNAEEFKFKPGIKFGILKKAARMAKLQFVNTPVGFKELLSDPANVEKIKQEVSGIKCDNIIELYQDVMFKMGDVKTLKTNYINIERKADSQEDFRVTEIKETFKVLQINDDKALKSSVDYAKYGMGSTSAFVRVVESDDNSEYSICNLPNAINSDSWLTIHELGHVIDNVSVMQGSKKINKSGFDIYESIPEGAKHCKINDNGELTDYTVDEMQENHGKRQYEILNEVINDYITKKVTAHFERGGDRIGLREVKKGDKHSIYVNGFDVFGEFIDRHFDKIIECKMSDDILKTAGEYFGYDNLNRLAKMASKYVYKRDSLTNEAEIQDLREKARGAIDEVEQSMQMRQDNAMSI